MSPNRSGLLSFVAVLAALVLIGCGDQDAGILPETTARSELSSTVAPSITMTITTAATTTASESTTTLAATTTAVPRGLEIVMPFDGEVGQECEFGPIGVVRPRASVTYLGEKMIPDGEYGPPYSGSEGWQRWVGGDGEPYPLNEGANTLEFVATFDDGSTISTTITVTCDPSLESVPGYVTALTTDDGVNYELGFEAGRFDDQPDGWDIVDTVPTAFVVDDDASFVVYPRGSQTILSPSEFAALIAENCVYDGVAFDLLVDTNDTARQARQLEERIDFCRE